MLSDISRRFRESAKSRKHNASAAKVRSTVILPLLVLIVLANVFKLATLRMPVLAFIGVAGI